MPSFRKRSNARRIRPASTVKAARTKPSPAAPNPFPGVTTTPAFTRSSTQKLLDVNPAGTGTQA